MKGTYFLKPFEFKLQVEGEAWNQGDLIRGTLELKNHGSAEADPGEIAVQLAYADMKEVAKKSPEAFEMLATFPLKDTKPLSPQENRCHSWEFQLDRNCPITDKSSSLYLLYGQTGPIPVPGQLQINVLPDKYIQDVLKILQIEFRFVVRYMKAKKGQVEIKFAPSSARAFVSMENLFLYFRFTGDQKLEMELNFTMKKVDLSSGSMALAKTKTAFQNSFSPQEYILPNKRLDEDRIKKFIDDYFRDVTAKVQF